VTDPSILKQQAKDLVKNWPSDLLNLIDITPDETLSKTPLVDRWNWPGISPGPSRGSVVLVGDAWHPMTPNLGQGACCALEDSVVLARKLAGGFQIIWGREVASCLSVDNPGECGWIVVAVGEPCGLWCEESRCDS
ncbi:unnamed protein product, partial [Linum tenue]